MKKVLGIYIGVWNNNEPYWDEKTVREVGMGGSETWVVELASEFQKRGYHVVVFSNPEYWHFAEDGVEYVPWYLFKARCEYQHFDYFITSRRCDEIDFNISCLNIYMMAHDMRIWNCFDYHDLKMDRIRKIGYLSEWHKEFLKSVYIGLDDKQLFRTANGVNVDMYVQNATEDKENYTVWSSCPERGLEFFVNNVLPKIREVVPDFKVKVCTYCGTSVENVRGKDGVEIIGRLNKEELCKIQEKAKIFVYSNLGKCDDGGYFHETFCITALENALSKNAVIAVNNGGLSSTLEGYSGLVGGDLGDIYGTITKENEDKVANLLAESAIKALSDSKYRKELVNEAYNIAINYTWKNVVDNWIKVFEEN